MCALSEVLLYLQDLGNSTGVLKNEANINKIKGLLMDKDMLLLAGKARIILWELQKRSRDQEDSLKQETLSS